MKTVRQSLCVFVFVFFLGCVHGGTAKDDPEAGIKKLKAEITKLIQAGRDMEQYRNSSSSDACEEKMNKYTAVADQLRKDAMELPINVDLRMALYQLPTCVSCESYALESCDSLENDLKEMEE